jgi:hypothetical protein
VRRTPAWPSRERLRLTLLLALAAALLAYLVVARTNAFGTASAGAPAGSAADCPERSAPPVTLASATTLQEMREDLRGAMSGRERRLYEEGPIAELNAWNDNPPAQRQPPDDVSKPGAYELRWWAPDGDDVVDDAFLFSQQAAARKFFALASSPACRPAAVALSASSPPQGRNLAWRNPDGYAQEDLYMQRGRLVYRVGVVRADAGASVTHAARSAAFAFVDGLACALPGAGCHASDDRALARQTLAEQLALVRRQLPGLAAEGSPSADPGDCATSAAGQPGETASASSESLRYGEAFGVRLAVHVFSADGSARSAISLAAKTLSLRCVAHAIASELLHAHRSPAGVPLTTVREAAVGQGALVGQVSVPFVYRGRRHWLTEDTAIVRQGRVVDVLAMLAPVTTAVLVERLGAQLARLAAGEQR